MKRLSGTELREEFLKFFKGKGHLILPSAPLVPRNDPTLLWINAGMAPLKPYFDGRETPPRRRVATCQKCIRTNDIENVGRTTRHHTFFEMLGNFSFGDYFKEEAISWAWEFITEVLEFDPQRLWITIYRDDDEAFAIWKKIGVPEEKIVRMGKKDNFWEIGTGPCGPCSEIHYDRGYACGPDCKLGCDCDRWVEVWNLVFTQYDRTEDGDYLTLPQKNIDTGMGLERVASILQGVESNFDTDLFMPTINKVQEMSGKRYRGAEGRVKMAFRVIADHIRTITFAIADGALPSNEGTGYVIRRVLRRAVRFGKELDFNEPFLYLLVPAVIEAMGSAYPEIVKGQEHITRVIKREEERFYTTLDQGLEILESYLMEMEERGQSILSGSRAFKLYDTYGFPLDLTRDVAGERGFEVDEEGFNKALEAQRKRAREARKDEGEFGEKEIYLQLRKEFGTTEFTGYDSLEEKAEVLAIIRNEQRVETLVAGEEGQVVLSVTPMYAEGGGQVGDRGWITAGDVGVKLRVKQTVKRAEIHLHQAEVMQGELRVGQKVLVSVDEDLRRPTMQNHSATHLLHWALREVLGEHVQQSGSLVEPGRLRFDFSHFQALSTEEIREIEDKVNEIILKDYPVVIEEMPLEEARKKGVIALFGEKYGDLVRVVEMGPSKELCGGTHVKSVGRIGIFKIISEGGVAAGIRRIEAVTGKAALKLWRQQEKTLQEAGNLLKAEPREITRKIQNLQDEFKDLQQELESLKQKLAHRESANMLENVEIINGLHVIISAVQGMDTDGLRKMGDKLKAELGSGIILLASTSEKKVLLVAMVTDDLVKRGFHAGKLIGPVARVVGGGGGGRPGMAQAGGSSPEKLDKAFSKAREILKEWDIS